jgi:hypothetical protein
VIENEEKVVLWLRLPFPCSSHLSFSMLPMSLIPFFEREKFLSWLSKMKTRGSFPCLIQDTPEDLFCEHVILCDRKIEIRSPFNRSPSLPLVSYTCCFRGIVFSFIVLLTLSLSLSLSVIQG